LYVLKHTTRTVRAQVRQIHHRVDINTLEKIDTSSLSMNDIALVKVQTTLPLIFDPYRQIATTGSFILIDPITNATVAAGMIQQATGKDAAFHSAPTVTVHDRFERFAHRSAAIWVDADDQVAHRIERRLFDTGCDVHLVNVDSFDDIELSAIARAFHATGAVVIFATQGERSTAQVNVSAVFSGGTFFRADRNNCREMEAALRHKVRNIPNERGRE
jgi:hypothetical protein